MPEATLSQEISMVSPEFVGGIRQEISMVSPEFVTKGPKWKTVVSKLLELIGNYLGR